MLLLSSFSRVTAVALAAALTITATAAAERIELTNQQVGARDRFWRHAVTEESLVHDGVNHYHNIKSCIQNTLTEEELQDMATVTSTTRKAGKMLHDQTAGHPVLVVVEDAMHPVHVKAVQALASCIRTFLPHLYESRAMYQEMDLDEDPGLGGNCPTHLAPLVGVFLPEVIREMDRTIEVAYEAAGWQALVESDHKQKGWRRSEKMFPPSQVGVRASEHLTYSDFPSLAEHTDGEGTVYTVNFAFSGPDDYNGGEFYIITGQGKKREYQYVKPNKYECMVFLGGRYLHGVEEIKGGHREMFSTEFWPYPDSPFGSNLWSNFPGNMENHIEACNEEIAQGNTGPCKSEYSTRTPFHESMDEVKGKYAQSGGDDDNDSKGFADEPLLPPIKGINRKKLDKIRPNRIRPSELKPASIILHDRAGNEYDMDAHFFSEEEEPDFLIPRTLEPGQMEPIRWREDFAPVDGSDGETFVIGFPKELHEEFVKYIANNGMMGLAKQILYKDDKFKPGEQRIYTLDDGEKWTAMIQGAWNNDMIWLDPGDESAFESLLGVLRRGGFDNVLEQMGKAFDLDGLMIQGVGAIFISENNKTDNMHSDIPGSRGSFYNVIVPVHIPEGDISLFKVCDTGDVEGSGALRLDPNVGVILGGESVHGTGECNYREKEDFRLSFAIYVADINDKNVELIASDSTSLWPTEGDTFWFEAQKGRLWTRDGTHSLKNDKGRAPMNIQDSSPDCATMDKEVCMTDLQGMRLECPKTCELYLEDDAYFAKYFPESLSAVPTACKADPAHPTCPNSDKTATA